jgi:hypothetical protein
MTTTETVTDYERFAPQCGNYDGPTSDDLLKHLIEQPPTGETERGAAADMLLRHAAYELRYGKPDKANALTRLATAHTFRAIN